ncbi:MAG: DUF3499 domain-containing protein [Actinomycetales bacterium]
MPAEVKRPSGSGRRCSRSGCNQSAAKTLIYIYSDSTAVLGPLSTFAELHTFDFCMEHSDKLTVPKGWNVIKHDSSTNEVEPSAEDLMAIADAVREVGKQDFVEKRKTPEVGRRGHLRSIPNQN